MTCKIVKHGQISRCIVQNNSRPCVLAYCRKLTTSNGKYSIKPIRIALWPLVTHGQCLPKAQRPAKLLPVSSILCGDSAHVSAHLLAAALLDDTASIVRVISKNSVHEHVNRINLRIVGLVEAQLAELRLSSCLREKCPFSLRTCFAEDRFSRGR